MTHPTDKLADFIDGSLDVSERAGVSAHLEGCAECRQEVELARRAKGALTSLPELPVPLGASRRVGTKVKENRNATAYRIAAFAAAAAVVGIFAVILVRNPEEPMREVSAFQSADQGQAPAAPPATDLSDDDYTSAELQAVAASAGQKEAVTAGATSDEELAQRVQAKAATGPPTPQAEKCLKKSGAFAKSGELIGVIDAKFEGTPAFIGVLREEPPGGGSDNVVVWVASKGGCSVLALAQAPG
ncbi:MAG: zf-HC2 domain-containing protein [Actinomycetota bacterium]